MTHSGKLSKEVKVGRFSGVFVGVIAAGVATVALGCLSVSVELFSDARGKGGGTTSTTTGMGGAGGGVPCLLPTSPCEDDENPCTTEACTDGFCTQTPLTMDTGPGSTECMMIACKDGAPTTTIHDGKP